MSSVISWIAAEADDRGGSKGKNFADGGENPHFWQNRPELGHPSEISPDTISPEDLPAHQFGEKQFATTAAGSIAEQVEPEVWEDPEEARQRRIYRGRTIGMLRRYMRYSIETGRLPSLLGKEFFRAKVTAYTVVTFEDRVIFVHDMERCLEKLDEFSRQVIARHILQEHDQAATARLLGCGERTVRRMAPLALDQLSEILLDLGMMRRLDEDNKKSCQGGLRNEIAASDCEDSENKF